MVSRLRTSFKVMIDNLLWMENTTKEIAKEKVNAFFRSINDLIICIQICNT